MTNAQDTDQTLKVDAASTVKTPSFTYRKTKAEVLERLKEIVENNEDLNKAEVDYLKTTFYKFHRAETETLCQKFLEDGGKIEDFLPAPDPDEAVLKQYMATIKERRQEERQEEDKIKEENLQKKQAILDQLKACVEKPEEANQSYESFHKWQEEWNAITLIPAEKVNELWKSYQQYREQYYDLDTLDDNLRQKDFEQNLKEKEQLIQEAEGLSQMDDVVSAFTKLQNIQESFRAVGPVAKDKRDEIRERFKAAASVINKKHQAHFESLRKQENENFEAKKALCDAVEEINKQTKNDHRTWNKLTEKVIATQAKWKTIGFTPQKLNAQVFDRFRKACDEFFKAKGEFYKQNREKQDADLKRRLELCQQAEELQDSTDWQRTASKIINLQKEWKTLGYVPRKQNESTWNRFQTACNHFFDARKASGKGNDKPEEVENLKKKKEIIEKIKAIDLTQPTKENIELFIGLQKEWSGIGYVPMRNMRKINDSYKRVADKVYDAFRDQMTSLQMDDFKSKLEGKNHDDLYKENKRLTRMRSMLSSQLQTYERNLSFMDSKSKQGNALITEITRKVDKLKKDLQTVEDKLALINKQAKEN